MKNLTLKQHWTIATGLMIAGVIVSTIDIMVNMDNFKWWPMIVAIVLVGGGYIYHLKFVKCPYCGARLPSKTKFPEKCDVCGKSLAKYNK